jgi:mannosyltransferase
MKGGAVSRVRWAAALVALVCAAFAFKALALIDATTLWSDELYSVGKSFQPSYPSLLAMLREDTHPPLYYSLLWFWGRWLDPSAVSLRLLSWLAYGLGAVLISRQAWALAPPAVAGRAAALAALLAFCSPYPVRFSIEGKSYALLVLLVVLALMARRRCLQSGRSTTGLDAYGLAPYALAVAAAALTHFYGLFLFAAAALWDGCRRRWALASCALMALLPAVAWIGYASAYLFSSRPGSWIGRPDFALLEDTLARALGPWPLPKLALLLLMLWALGRWGLSQSAAGARQAPAPRLQRLADSTGLGPSLLMVLGVVLLSWVKPMAFSRYFVVLLPALVPWLSVRAAYLPLNGRGRALALVGLALMLGLWWQQAFADLDSEGGSREADQFRAISQLTADQPERYSPRPRLLNLSDRMEVAAGRIQPSVSSWGDDDALRTRLHRDPLPEQIWLAASGPDAVVRRRLKPLGRELEAAGFRCRSLTSAPRFSQVLQCRSAASPSGDP